MKVGYLIPIPRKFKFIQTLDGDYVPKAVSREEFDKIEQSCPPPYRYNWNRVGYPVAKIKGEYVRGIPIPREKIFYYCKEW